MEKEVGNAYGIKTSQYAIDKTAKALKVADQLTGTGGGGEQDEDYNLSDEYKRRIDIQKRELKRDEELLALMLAVPEVYPDSEIAEQRAKIDAAKRKLRELQDWYIEEITGRSQAQGEGNSNPKEWEQEWVDGYDTPQEAYVRKAKVVLGNELDELLDFECFRLIDKRTGKWKTNLAPKDLLSTIKYERIKADKIKLEQLLQRSKERRRSLRTTEDAGSDERKTDKLGNPTEKTVYEIVDGILIKLFEEGIIGKEGRTGKELAEILGLELDRLDDADLGLDDEEDIPIVEVE